MAYTQAQLDALDAQILEAGAVESTAFDNQSTKFRPIRELLELRATMAASIAGNRTRYAATRKGT